MDPAVGNNACVSVLLLLSAAGSVCSMQERAHLALPRAACVCADVCLLVCVQGLPYELSNFQGAQPRSMRCARACKRPG